MKFTISSTTLLNRLQTIGKVIASKNAMSILDNFLMEINGNKLTLTASDLETTISSSIDIEDTGDNIAIALPAKLLTETLKEFAEQPLTFDINTENLAVEFKTETGKFNFIGLNGNEYPQEPALKDDMKVITINPETLANGVNRTAFATATEDTRPTMTGVFFKFDNNQITFVATDAHKLVRLTNKLEGCEIDSSFILPKKTANLLKNLLANESEDIMISFDDKNIIFEMSHYRTVSRQIEGKYPNYNSVIPQNNPYEIIIDRMQFANAIKRVGAFANQSTNLIKLNIETGNIHLSAQDIDFSISAQENLACQFEGDPIRIGFKAPLLTDILNSIDCNEVRLQLADPSRAGIILPLENEENEDVLMLLMPMLINE